MNIPEHLECLSDHGADPVRRRCVKTCAALVGGALLAVLLLIDHTVTVTTAKPVIAQQGDSSR